MDEQEPSHLVNIWADTPRPLSSKDEQMKLAHDQGQSYAQIGKTFGISRMSVYRRLKGHIEAKKEAEIHCKNNQKS